MNDLTAAALNLSPAEKLQLVEDLWDDLARTPEAVPVQDWQVEEIERRQAEYANDPASGSSWEEVERRIKGRHAK